MPSAVLSQVQGPGCVALCGAHRKQPEGLPVALRLGENLVFACGLGILSLLCSEGLPAREPSLHVR